MIANADKLDLGFLRQQYPLKISSEIASYRSDTDFLFLRIEKLFQTFLYGSHMVLWNKKWHV